MGESAAEQAWSSKFGFPTPPRKRYMIMCVPVTLALGWGQRGEIVGDPGKL